jgi:hypothetical protein
LNVVPKSDDFSSEYLRSLPNNAKKTSRITHRTDLGRVSMAIHSKSNYIHPRVIANDHEIKNAGTALFKDNKIVGWLDELKSNYLKWISGHAKGSTVSINMPGSKVKDNWDDIFKILKVDVKVKVKINQIGLIR